MAFLSYLNLWVQWVMTSLSILLGVTLAPLMYLVVATANKDSAEVSAGYTTFPRTHIELEQRDPYLGRVIRKPGEQFLEPDRFNEIASQAQEELRRS